MAAWPSPSHLTCHDRAVVRFLLHRLSSIDVGNNGFVSRCAGIKLHDKNV